jgi:hypothetical protein
MRSRKVGSPCAQNLGISTDSRTPAAFVDFLENFKSSSTEAAEQLEGLNINGDDDEYDMVDDSDDPVPNGNQRRNRHKAKYMQMLQDVADRMRTEVLIDLNDLETVRTITHVDCFSLTNVLKV